MTWPSHLAHLMVTLIVANEEKGVLATWCWTAWLMRATREGGPLSGSCRFTKRQGRLPGLTQLAQPPARSPCTSEEQETD